MKMRCASNDKVSKMVFMESGIVYEAIICMRLPCNQIRAARKPGSVFGNHLSRRTVTSTLQRLTSRAAAGRRFYALS